MEDKRHANWVERPESMVTTMAEEVLSSIERNDRNNAKEDAIDGFHEMVEHGDFDDLSNFDLVRIMSGIINMTERTPPVVALDEDPLEAVEDQSRRTHLQALRSVFAHAIVEQLND